MFVYVRLIDSQEHQYPNKKPDPNIQEKPKTKIQKNHRPIKPGIQDPKKNREKTNVLKNQVPESFNQGKQNPDPPLIQASFENELKFVPPDEPCSFLVRFSTTF